MDDKRINSNIYLLNHCSCIDTVWKIPFLIGSSILFEISDKQTRERITINAEIKNLNSGS